MLGSNNVGMVREMNLENSEKSYLGATVVCVRTNNRFDPPKKWIKLIYEDKTISNYILIDDAGPIPAEELEEAERLGNEAAQMWAESQ